jgi:hypothetical protein
MAHAYFRSTGKGTFAVLSRYKRSGEGQLTEKTKRVYGELQADCEIAIAP